jgi:hypothetical protein
MFSERKGLRFGFRVKDLGVESPGLHAALKATFDLGFMFNVNGW